MNKREKHVFQEFIKYLRQQGVKYNAQSSKLYKKSGNDDEGWSQSFVLSGMASGFVAAANELEGLMKGLGGKIK